MEILCTILVIYVAADLIASAYVVYSRGGIKATIQEVRGNLGFTRDSEE
jgi:hypothetical protein